VSQFEVTRETVGDTIVLRLRGDLDMAVSPELREQLAAALEAKPKRIIVDMKEISFMDSSGVAVLVVALQACGRKRMNLSLAAPSAPVRNVLEMSGLHAGVFEIVDQAP
jgi:anti-sigma B factor antagonist